MKKIIADILAKVLKNLYNLESQDIDLETPPKPDFWDFAFPCFPLARELKKAPQVIASEIKNCIEKDTALSSYFQELSLAWWYLNLTIKKSFISEYFFRLLEDKTLFATFPKKDETIIVDYIGTNVWKPLHIGHMCTPNIGQTLVNLYRKLGYNVIGDSHIGDWGIIFGKLILAYTLWWDEKKLRENAVNHLFELYVKITEAIEKEINQDKKNLFWAFYYLVSLFWEELPEVFKWNWLKYAEDSNFAKFEELRDILYKNFPKKKKDFIQKFKDIKYYDIEDKIEQATRNEFKKLSEWNPDSVKLWKEFTKHSIEAMQKELDRLHVKADYNIGESFYEGLWLPKMENYPDLEFTMKDIVEELIQKWIATKNEDNSVGINFPEETKLPSCILQKRDGTHGYLASDLSAIKYRTQNWNPSKIIYCVDMRQELHFKQAFYIARQAWWLTACHPTTKSCSKSWKEAELFHAANGFISLKDGAMSTRKGKIIPLKDLLDEAETRAEKIILEKRQDLEKEELEKLKKIIGIGAIKYGYLSKSRLTSVIFDWEEFMTFEWNSAPYIQYAFVRANSILRQAGDMKKIWKDKKTYLEEKEEIELMKELFNYKEVLLQTEKEKLPHFIANYAYEITKKFNTFYNHCHILNEENEGKKYLRLHLITSFTSILKECFSLLAIELPERM